MNSDSADVVRMSFERSNFFGGARKADQQWSEPTEEYLLLVVHHLSFCQLGTWNETEVCLPSTGSRLTRRQSSSCERRSGRLIVSDVICIRFSVTYLLTSNRNICELEGLDNRLI
jgi:hypothetical protein